MAAPAAAAAVSTASAYISAGRLVAAVDALDAVSRAAPLPAAAYASLLRLSAASRSASAARRVASHLTRTLDGAAPASTFLFNRTIEALAACGALADARRLFETMPRRDGGSWHAIIAAASRAGSPGDALALFSGMNRCGVAPKDVTLASVLGSCAEVLDLALACQVHGLVAKAGFCCNVILGTALVDVYGKCLALEDAGRAFDSIPRPNAVSWNVMVRRYLLAGEGDMAVDVFSRMVGMGVQPLHHTVSHVLLACRDAGALVEGRCIHAFLLRRAYEHGAHVRSSLVDMYAKCGAIEAARTLYRMSPMKHVVMSTSIVTGLAACGRIAEAEKVFDGMTRRNVVSWNAMLTAYVRRADWTSALNLFKTMRQKTMAVDTVTLCSVLNACAGLLDVRKGEEGHAFAYKRGMLSHLSLRNALVRMYAKCGSLRSAERLFVLEMASEKDTVSWNSLISGYERHYRSEAALRVLTVMASETAPNKSTLSSALAACANIFQLDHGKQIHASMIRKGFEIDDILRSALIDMYSKCRLFDYSIRVFEAEPLSRDVVVWNSMIFGCAYSGRGEHGLKLFDEMRREGIRPDSVTFLCALVSCIGEGHVDLGRSYYSLMTKECGIIPRLEHCECMVELLGRHGCMVELEDFVERMPFEPTGAMWLRIFECCRDHGNRRLGERAARCINEVQFEFPSGYRSGDDGCAVG